MQDFPELGVIRGLLGAKYGKDFVAGAAADGTCRQWNVNDNLIMCGPVDQNMAKRRLLK